MVSSAGLFYYAFESAKQRANGCCEFAKCLHFLIAVKAKGIKSVSRGSAFQYSGNTR